MTINGFFSRLKSNGANQTQKVRPEIFILKQRLSELSTQWSFLEEQRTRKEKIPLKAEFDGIRLAEVAG
jgi:hypothetical protein